MFDPSRCTMTGSIQVLVDAFYTDKVRLPNAKGKAADWDYYFLCLLFGHKAKDGKVTVVPRRIKLIAEPVDEFKLFWKAYFGYDCLLTEPLDFKVFSEELIQDIHQNNYNFRILFGHPAIVSITKLNESSQFRCPGMIWPDTMVKLYPGLVENNEALEAHYMESTKETKKLKQGGV